MRSLCLFCASKSAPFASGTSATQWCSMIPTHPELAILLHRYCIYIWAASGTQAASSSDVFLPLKVQQSYLEHLPSTAHGFIDTALTRLLCYVGVSLKNIRNCHFCSDKIYSWEKSCLEKCHRSSNTILSLEKKHIITWSLPLIDQDCFKSFVLSVTNTAKELC